MRLCAIVFFWLCLTTTVAAEPRLLPDKELERLRRQLESEDSTERRQAIKALAAALERLKPRAISVGTPDPRKPGAGSPTQRLARSIQEQRMVLAFLLTNAGKNGVPAVISALREDIGEAMASKHGEKARDLGRLGPDAVANDAALKEIIREEEMKPTTVESPVYVGIVRAGASAATVLIAALRDDNAYLRGFALEALRRVPRRGRSAGSKGELDAIAKRTVTACRKALGDKHWFVRIAAARVLVRTDETLREKPLQSVAELLEEPVTRVLLASVPGTPATRDLRRLNVAAFQKSPDPTVRERAVQTVSTALAAEEDPDLRSAAANLLAAFKVSGDDVASRLVPMWTEGRFPENFVGAHALATMGPEAKAAVPDVSKKLKSRSPQDRYWSLLILGQVGSAARSSIRSVRRLVDDAHPQVRIAAVDTLQKLGAKPETVVEAALRAMDGVGGLDGDRLPQLTFNIERQRFGWVDGIRHVEVWSREGTASVDSMASVLGRILGVKAEPSRKALGEVAKVKSSASRAAALKLLKSIRQPEAWGPAGFAEAEEIEIRPVGRKAKPSGRTQPTRRRSAARGTDEATKRVAELIERVKSEKRHEVGDALRRLAAFGPQAKSAIAVVIPKLERAPGDRDTRALAAFVLAKVGPAASSAMPALLQSLVADYERGVFGSDTASLERAALRIDAGIIARELAAILTDRSKSRKVRQGVARACGRNEALARATVPALAEVLSDEDARLRMLAAEALERIGPDAQEAVQALTETIRGPGYHVAPIAALGAIGPAAKAAAPSLLERLKDNSNSRGRERDRAAAASALGRIGAATKNVVVALVAALDGPGEAVRFEAIAALIRIGKVAREEALPPLAEALRSEKEGNRLAAAIALMGFGRADLGSPVVEAAFADPSSSRRACKILAALGPAASPVVPVVREVLERKPIGLEDLVKSIETIGTAAAPLRPTLVSLLTSTSPRQNPRVRASILKLLGGSGPEAAKVVPTIVSVMKSVGSDSSERRLFLEAVRALGAIGPPAKSALPALEAQQREIEKQSLHSGLYPHHDEALHELSVTIRRIESSAAAQTAPRTDPTAAARPAPKEPRFRGKPASFWMAQLDSDDKNDRRQAIKAFAAMGARGLPGLRKALKGSDSFVRTQAIQAIGGLGSSAKAAMPDLLELFEGKPGFTRQSVLLALRRLGPHAAEAVPSLIQGLETDQPSAWLMIQVLGAIGPAAKSAIPVLETCLSDGDRRESHAIVALTRIGGDGVPLVIRALQKKRDRRARAGLIHQIGQQKEAPGAAAILVELSKHEDRQVAAQASSFLSEMGPRASKALLSIVKEGSREERISAAITLAKMKVDPASIRPVLEEGLASVGPRLRIGSALALVGLGDRRVFLAPALREAVEVEPPRAFGRAASSLARIRGQEWLRPFLTREERRGLLDALGDSARPDHERVGALRQLVFAPSPEASGGEKRVPRLRPELPDSVVSAVVAAASDDDPVVRLEAIHAVAAIGPRAKAARPQLERIVVRRAFPQRSAARPDVLPEFYWRSEAAAALLSLGEESVPVVLGAFRADIGDAFARKYGEKAARLGRRGPDAFTRDRELRPIIDAVRRDLEAKAPPLESALFSRIALRGSPESGRSTAALLAALADENAYLRLQAVNWLGRLELRAEDAVLVRDAIARATRDKHRFVAAAAKSGRMDDRDDDGE